MPSCEFEVDLNILFFHVLCYLSELCMWGGGGGTALNFEPGVFYKPPDPSFIHSSTRGALISLCINIRIS